MVFTDTDQQKASMVAVYGMHILRLGIPLSCLYRELTWNLCTCYHPQPLGMLVKINKIFFKWH